MKHSNHRPLRDEYLAVAKLISTDHYLLWDQDFFVKQLQRIDSNMTDKRARSIHEKLVKEAKTADINKDHEDDPMWAYYMATPNYTKMSSDENNY